MSGIWPKAHKNVRAIITFTIFIFVGIIPAIHALIRNWGNMMSTIDNLQYILPLASTVMKMIVIWLKKDDLAVVIDMIAEDWIKTKTDKEWCVMIKQAQNARILTAIGYIIMLMGVTLIVILPCFGMSVRYITNITDPNKILPLQGHYLYNKDRSPFFELTFFAQSIMLVASAAVYGGTDNLLGLAAFHLCGQMENLEENLIEMSKFKTFYSGLVFIVKEHIRLIRCFNIIENTSTVLLLGLLVCFSILFGLCGFSIIAILTKQGDVSIMRFMFLASVELNICIHMCVFCAVGEFLVTRCERIYYAAYRYEWYELEPKEAKTLMLLMIRTSKPLYITAGKIFPMTMSTFCNILKTSVGYISILLAKVKSK